MNYGLVLANFLEPEGMLEWNPWPPSPVTTPSIARSVAALSKILALKLYTARPLHMECYDPTAGYCSVHLMGRNLKFRGTNHFITCR